MRGKPASALGIIGLVFSLIGLVFAVSGSVTWYFAGETEAWMVGPVHLLIGCVFLTLGVIFLITVGIRRKKARQLKENGRYLWGEIVELKADAKIRINHRHPYYATVRYAAPYGKNAAFRSDSFLALHGREDLIGRKVKIYVGDDTYRNYYVDIDSILK